MSKRSLDATVDLGPEGEGEGSPKQRRTATWYCARCKKEINDNEYYKRWWTQWRVGYYCMECCGKYEVEEAEKKKAEEATTKEKMEIRACVTESFACRVQG